MDLAIPHNFRYYVLMFQFLVLSASQNNNLKLAKTLSNALNSPNSSADIIDLVSLHLPLYSTSHHQNKGIPKQIHPLFEHCKQSQGFVFVAPEYNGGLPPVLVNAFAWLSVIEKDWRGVFNGKIAGIATSSGGTGQHLISLLRQQLATFGLTVIGRSLSTNTHTPLNDGRLNDFVFQILKHTNITA
jgi:chromate reductase